MGKMYFSRFALVKFPDEVQSKEALRKLQGLEIRGSELNVCYSQQTSSTRSIPEPSEGNCLYSNNEINKCIICCCHTFMNMKTGFSHVCCPRYIFLVMVTNAL